MNFVVFSYNFLPQSDAEAYCTARFCSALAETGNLVHVVTMDHLAQVSEEVSGQLLSDRLLITRIPMKSHVKRFMPRIRYMTPEWGSVNYPNAIRVLVETLRQYESPILISRSMPEDSHIVAYNARKYASKWVAHFSDPIPFRFGKGYGVKGWMWKCLSHRWIAKVLRACDAVSLTCEEAKLFYREMYGPLFGEKNSFVTPHIGNPSLVVRRHENRTFSERLIVHSGMLSMSRGSDCIAKALDGLNANGLRVRFIQVGPCDKGTRSLFGCRKDSEIIEGCNPDIAAGVVESSDVCLIADVQVPMTYTPFMPSKFVYQLFSDKPLVLLTKDGSPMWRISRQYTNACLFPADYENPLTLLSSLRQALDVSRADGWQAERQRVRSQFDSKTVADNFVRNVGAGR